MLSRLLTGKPHGGFFRTDFPGAPGFGGCSEFLFLLEHNEMLSAGHSAIQNCYIVAMIFNSIAMGVGRQFTSSVVRAGLGLPGPEKYSA